MSMDPMQNAQIIKAPGCPHYVSVQWYGEFRQRVGEFGLARLRCRQCLKNPVKVYGPFDRSGPVRERPATTGNPRGKGYLRRRKLEQAVKAAMQE